MYALAEAAPAQSTTNHHPAYGHLLPKEGLQP